MKLFLLHFPVLSSQQKGYMWKRHSLKGFWRPEIAQLKGFSACGIKADARKLQAVGEMEKYHLCSSLITKPNWWPLLSSSLLWGLIKEQLMSILWFLGWFPDMVYSLLCWFDGIFEPLEVLVWASENSCESLVCQCKITTGRAISLNPH